MSLSKQSRESLLDAILSITDKLGKLENAIITDLYIQVDKESGKLTIFDDDTLMLDKELLKGLDEEMDDFLKHLLED